MYCIAICDDEQHFATKNASLLREGLKAEGIPFELDVYVNPAEMLQAIERGQQYHMLLLDIIMGEYNGIEIARILRAARYPAGIIFITASTDFVFDGYDVQATQYLLKPVDAQKLAAAILLDYNNRFAPVTLLMKKGAATKALPVADIFYIESKNKKVHIHLNDAHGDNPFKYNGKLSEVAPRLPEEFCTCHKSYIVNLRHATAVHRYYFILDSGQMVPVSKSRFKAAQQQFLNYLR